MRAFMSRREDRWPIAASMRGPCAEAHARAAEREARAILAETEPTGHANRTGWAGDDPFPSVRYMVDATGYKALAEALAAFVEG